MPAVDAITVEVLGNRFAAIADEAKKLAIPFAAAALAAAAISTAAVAAMPRLSDMSGDEASAWPTSE